MLSLRPTPSSMLDRCRHGLKQDRKVLAPFLLLWTFKKRFVDKDSFHGIIRNSPIIYILVKFTIIKYLTNLKMLWSILKFMKVLNLFWTEVVKYLLSFWAMVFKFIFIFCNIYLHILPTLQASGCDTIFLSSIDLFDRNTAQKRRIKTARNRFYINL